MGWVDLVAATGWCWQQSLPSPTRTPEAAPGPSNPIMDKYNRYLCGVYVNIPLTCIQNEVVTWFLPICPIMTLCFVFACKKKLLFLIFVYIWCNQIPPPLKLISCCWVHPSYYWVFIFPWPSSVSNYFVLMLCDNVESAPPLILATCWIHCKQHIFQLFPAIIYLFISDPTISGYLMKLFSDGFIGQEGKKTESIQVH